MEPADSLVCGVSVRTTDGTLWYATPHLLSPLTLAGAASVEIHLAASAPVEVAASLVALAPDGGRESLASGASPASEEAGAVVVILGELDVEMPVGHRFAVEVQATSSEPLAALQVFHDAVRASCLSLAQAFVEPA